MVRLSVSQVAKLLGISRVSLQTKINNNQLHTHEGYLTMSDLQQAYPDFNPHSDQELHLKKMQQIKENALYKSLRQQQISQENQLLVDQSVEQLQEQVTIEQHKNRHYQLLVDELTQKLAYLEHHCHQADKKQLHQLQYWVKSNMTKH